VARQAIDRGVDTRVDPTLREFLYLPFMHSEALADQIRCIALSQRNHILGRTTTPDEQAFLDGGGFAPG